MKDGHRAMETVFIFSEVIIMILFIFCTEYGDNVHPDTVVSENAALNAQDMVKTYYPAFMDLHVMIFIGFGFLMAYLKTHSWTSIGYNFVISSFALQLTILVVGFWH